MVNFVSLSNRLGTAGSPTFLPDGVPSLDPSGIGHHLQNLVQPSFYLDSSYLSALYHA